MSSRSVSNFSFIKYVILLFSRIVLILDVLKQEKNLKKKGVKDYQIPQAALQLQTRWTVPNKQILWRNNKFK